MHRWLAIFSLFVFIFSGCSDDDELTPPNVPPTLISGDLILVPAGSFEMGAPAEELGFLGEEALHPVTLTTDFYIYSTEVTNWEYAELAQWALESGYCTVVGTRLYDNLDGSTLELLDMDDDEDCEISFIGSTFVVDPEFENHPVKEIPWFGAAAYCDWLSLKEGLQRAYTHADPTNWKCNDNDPYAAQGYRLPTEAEWEYSCRAGTSTAFSGGGITETGCDDEPSLSSMGWYCGNAGGWTNEVAGLSPNALEIYDMHGNLWEWCNDWHGDPTDEEINPIGPPPGRYKVLRGGAWSDLARRCRSASRHNPSPHLGINGRYGFRFVISAQ